ncbi:MAG: hypothetical protein ACRDX8_08795, partial [Acidimicrobiales bacterium]
WLVVAARCKMKTSPAAGTRYMSLNLIDPDGETILEMPAGDGQTPSGTQPYNWARGLEYVAETPSVINVAPLPHLILPPAYKVQLVMVQGQLVDKLEAVTLLVETFPTGPTGYPTGVVGYGEPPQPS